VTNRGIAKVGQTSKRQHSPGGARPVAGVNNTCCTERTLRGSKAVKSTQGTSIVFLGAMWGAPEDPLNLGGGSATDGETARRQKRQRGAVAAL
jgi:hypothetical protein